MKNIIYDKTKLTDAINTKLIEENISIYKLSFILGVDRGNLIKIIKGKSNPSVNYFCKITNWLKQPLENFISDAHQQKEVE